MPVVRYNPFSDTEDFPSGLRLFQDTVNRLLSEQSTTRPWAPPVDIFETDNALILKADVPDVDIKGVDIQIENGTLTLKGERKFEKDEGYILQTQAPGTVEIYKLYNRISGTHLYTENAGTRDAILAQFPGIWVINTSLGYGTPLPPSATPPTTGSGGISGGSGGSTQRAVSEPLAVSMTSTDSVDSSDDSLSRTGADQGLASVTSGTVAATSSDESTATVSCFGESLRSA